MVRMRREPQQERSRATRDALLDATIASLAEAGWHGTTVVGVAGRAGISRGAAQHHYATRDDLVRAAVERVSEGLAGTIRAKAAQADGRDRIASTLEALAETWTEVSGRAALQLWVAASADPTLRELVLPLERRFSRDLFDVAVELLGADPERPEVAEQVRLTLDLTRGVGIGALLRPEVQRRRADLAQWAAVLSTLPGFGNFGGF